MAAIPCQDYVSDAPGIVPKRISRTNPDALRNRWVNFILSLDLSPEQKDALGEGVGAWSLWDVPATHCAQIDDDRGEDLIAFSIMDNVFWFDWTRTQDEWTWNAFAPIHHLIRIGPLPSNPTETQPQGGFDLAALKRMVEFTFTLKDGDTGAPGAIWTVTVGEWDREEATSRTGQRATAERMRTQISVKGRAFIITLEHSANEPVHIDHWHAAWDLVGRRVREAGIV